MKISNKEYMKFIDYLAVAPLTLTDYYNFKEIMDVFFERPIQELNEDQDLVCVKCESHNYTNRNEKCWLCGKSLKLAKIFEDKQIE